MNSTDQRELLINCRYYFEGIALLPVSIIGIVGNLLSIIVLSCPEMKNDFNRLLLGLSTYDLIYLIMSTFIFTIPILSRSYAMTILPHIMPIGYGIAHLGRIGSVFMTLSVTVERYCAIVYPLKSFRLKTPLIMGSTLFTCLYNIPRFFEFYTQSKEIPLSSHLEDTNDERGSNVSISYRITPTDLRANSTYKLVYVVWMKFFLVELTPYIVISVLNAKIIQKILKASKERHQMTNGHRLMHQGSSRKLKAQDSIDDDETMNPSAVDLPNSNQQKKERNMATVLVCIVVLFLICQSLKIIPDIYEAIVCKGDTAKCVQSTSVEIIISISHFLLAVNSAANFGIYILRGDRFRQVLAKILFQCQWTKVSRRRNSPTNVMMMTIRRKNSVSNRTFVEVPASAAAQNHGSQIDDV